MAGKKFDLGDYEDVAARRKRLFVAFPFASIQTTTPEYVQRPGGEFVVRVTATVFRDPDDASPGRDVSEEPYPGRTPYTKDSEAENASTSAIGRAIDCVLPPIGKGGASRQEVQARHTGPAPTTSKQKATLWHLGQQMGWDVAGLAQFVADTLHAGDVTDPGGLLSGLTAQESDTAAAAVRQLLEESTATGLEVS